MRILSSFVSLALLCLFSLDSYAERSEIRVDPTVRLHQLSRLLTGAGIEDVNHEIYGGIYSQMIFGESFQEPPVVSPFEGFLQLGGDWKLDNESMLAGPGLGNKLVRSDFEATDGTVQVEVYFEDRSEGNAGLITRVSDPREGADNFFGYEISLYPSGNFLRLGKHRNNWELLRDVPCDVPLHTWIPISVKHHGNQITVSVSGQVVLEFTDNDPKNLESGSVGIRQWQRSARYRKLEAWTDEERLSFPFANSPDVRTKAVSSMWDQVVTGEVVSEFELEQSLPYVGEQSQTIRFVQGEGQVGVANRGLNRWGLHFQGEKQYEGIVVARSKSPTSLQLRAESLDGSTVVGEASIAIEAGKWQEIPFQFSTSGELGNAQFSVRLTQPGEVTLGYVFLQPGSWGRFKDLPLRRDVTELLQKQGITILRYGGSMINNQDYRWKKMIGPRHQRQPYKGFWYPYSTNGWGIIDFMDLCEAAGFEYAPTFSMHESVEDMQDFIRYATDPITTQWGAKRAADGRELPYDLKYLQLGNEERVDEKFAEAFNQRAAAIWALAPQVQLVVGDFVYEDLISDPHSFTGALSRITNMNGHQKILEHAQALGKEVWFDIHIWTAGPKPTRTLEAMFTYRDALKAIAGGAKFKVLTFEFNSNNHDHRRALANALAIHAIERDGEIPIATSANCLQPDKQNDNGWDQGLLFLSPRNVWLQPPGYVTQMYSESYADYLVQSTTEGDAQDLDVNAKVSEDGQTLVVNLVHIGDSDREVTVRLPAGSGYQDGTWVELSGSLDDANTESEPERIAPKESKVAMVDDAIQLRVQARSVSSLRFQKNP